MDSEYLENSIRDFQERLDAIEARLEKPRLVKLGGMVFSPDIAIIDYESLTVKVHGNYIALTKTEASLLKDLIQDNVYDLSEKAKEVERQERTAAEQLKRQKIRAIVEKLVGPKPDNYKAYWADVYARHIIENNIPESEWDFVEWMGRGASGNKYPTTQDLLEDKYKMEAKEMIENPPKRFRVEDIVFDDDE